MLKAFTQGSSQNLCDLRLPALAPAEFGNHKELKFHLQDLHKHITAFDFMLERKVTFQTHGHGNNQSR